MEWLASCTPHQVVAAVESLAPCRVEVICTARDLLRNFTAQWQEMTKNYRPWSWEEYVREITEDDAGPARHHFWRQQDVPEVLQRWLHAVPAERVHLVTVPPGGNDPELLWTRFCGVLGIDGSHFPPPPRDNASLGVVSTVLMRRLNLASQAHDLPLRRYKQLIQTTVANRVLAAHRTHEDPITVSPETALWIQKQAQSATAGIRALGVDVVGDLDDLVPGAPPAGREPNDVTDAELLDLCADALVALGVRQQQEIARLRARLRQASTQRPAPLTSPTLARVRRIASRLKGTGPVARAAGSRAEAAPPGRFPTD